LETVRASTYRIPMIPARTVYKAIILPKIIYTAQVWHPGPKDSKGAKALTAKLETFQNKSLKKIYEVYKTANVQVVRNKTHVPPVNFEIERRSLNHLIRKKLRIKTGIDKIKKPRKKYTKSSKPE